MNSHLYNMPDDILIHTISFLSVPDILLLLSQLSQTCELFHTLTRLHIVWKNAFKLDILSNNYPYSLDYEDLEQRTRHTYRLASRWLADTPLIPASETSFTGLPVSKIKFIPGRQHKWLLTICKVIWSVLTIWDIAHAHKCSEWSPKGEQLHRVMLNVDPESEVSMAVSFYMSKKIVLLNLDDLGTLHEIHSIDIDIHPVNLTGDILALSDFFSKTIIYNWKTEERAYLEEGHMQFNYCIQVNFTSTTIQVLRAHSINFYAFPNPLVGQTHTPIAAHSFGWVGGISVPSPEPNSLLSIFVRSNSSSPWASELDELELYSLSSFPPTLVSKVSSRSGPLHCTDIILGKHATAVWIHLHKHIIGPHWEKMLIAAIFPGPLNPTAQVRVREVCLNTVNNRTVLDYDEELGRIALESACGEATIIQL
ncbi:hypothetical protein DFS33DRAFT_1265690 [Desarmillaria ectypa]|nr:hypothetical protein DFS33DRAFT_1265690 [Desarmillaria ectypa]